MTSELSKEQFINTMNGEMTDVTESEEAVVDIWDYVEELVNQRLIKPLVLERNLVEKVYRNTVSTFDHILLPTETTNNFIVIIVDLIQKKIAGHYKLNLNEEYGLEE